MNSLYTPFVEKISQLTHAVESLEADSSFLQLKKTYQLNRLESLAHSFQKKDIHQALQDFFLQHFKKFYDTIFFYTADPQDPLNQLLIEIASKTFDHPFSVVCPNVSCISCIDGFEDFDASTDLAALFQNHLIGEKGRYLIPIKLLTSIDIAEPRFPNPYFDERNHPELAAYLNTEELYRLQFYSEQTIAWFEVRQQYKQLMNDQSHLLGVLLELLTHMFFNSAHGGIGQADNAGSGVYSAIIRFNQYFQKIHRDDIARIPTAVLQAIETLLRLSSDPSENINATQELRTCIGTQREHLLEQVKQHEAELMQIGLDRTEKLTLLSTIKDEFERANTILLTPSGQVGSDKLKLPFHLFETLSIQLEFMHLEDVLNFLWHSAELFPEIIEKQQLVNQILDFFLDFQHWVEFNLDLPIHLLRPFLKTVKPKLFEYFLHQSEALGIWLSLSNMDYFKVILEELNEQIWNFIDNEADCCQVLSILSDEQQSYFFEKYFHQIVSRIEDIISLISLLGILNIETRLRLYDSILVKIDSIIHSGQDLACFLQILSPQKQTQFFRSYIPKLHSFMRRAVDVEEVFNVLPLQLKQEFIESILPLNRLYIHSVYDFGKVMEILNEQQQKILWHQWKNDLEMMISDGMGFSHVVRHLTSSYYEAWVINFLEKLPLNIEDGYDFNAAMRHLPDTMRFILFKNCLSLLPNLIINGSDFSCAMYYLSPIQKHQLADVCKLKLPHWIEGQHDLTEILCYLNLLQAEALLVQLQPKLSQWIHQVEDYRFIVYGLPDSHIEVFLKHTTSLLMQIIGSSKDLIQICEIMDKTNLKRLLSLQWNNILNFDFSPDQLCEIFKYLNHQQREILLLKLEVHSGLRIQTVQQILGIISHLLPLQKHRFIVHHFSLIISLSNQVDNIFLMLPHLNRIHQIMYINVLLKMSPDLLNSSTHWIQLFKLLHPNAQKWVYRNQQPKITLMISCSHDFNQMMAYLNPDLKPLFFAEMIAKIPNMIMDTRDYVLVMENLEKTQGIELYERLKPQSKKIINTIFDIKNMMQFIPNNYHADFLLFIQSELKKMIKTVEDLCFFMLELTTFQKEFLLMLKQSDLQSLINSIDDLSLLLPLLPAGQIDWLFKNFTLSFDIRYMSINQMKGLLEHLSFNQLKQVISSLNSVFQYRLFQPNIFVYLLLELEENAAEYLASCALNRHPQLFWSPSFLTQAIDILSDQKCLKLFQGVADNFDKIFRFTTSLIDFIHRLIPHHQLKFIQYFQVKIIMKIQNPGVFSYFFSNLDTNNVKSILQYPQDYSEIIEYIQKKEVQHLLSKFLSKECFLDDTHQAIVSRGRF